MNIEVHTFIANHYNMGLGPPTSVSPAPLLMVINIVVRCLVMISYHL